MAAMVNTFNQTTNCCSAFAAATSSARISRIMDTAMIMVVSIIICLINLRLRVWLT